MAIALDASRLRALDSDKWIEEPGATALDEAHSPTHSYLSPQSVTKGDDGLVYFTESNDVAHAEDAGKVGIMKNAYDCARDIKYMCIGNSDWRNDVRSQVQTRNDPALPIYRKYLCDDAPGDSKFER